tara:strand:+ start:1114 stop:1683 length:570 start_codon:yes stop_codon:yes gene_type:complete
MYSYLTYSPTQPLLSDASEAFSDWLSTLTWEKRYEQNYFKFENDAIRIDLNQSMRALTNRTGLYWCVNFLRVQVAPEYRGNGTTENLLNILLAESPSDFYYSWSPINKTLIKALEKMGCEKQKTEGIYPDYCYPLRDKLRPDDASRKAIAEKLNDDDDPDVRAFSEGRSQEYFYQRRDHLQMLADMCTA